MNKLIPLALVIGMAWSQVQAEENQLPEIQWQDKIWAIIATTWKNMNASLWADDIQRTQWNKNIENIARVLLPGNPVRVNVNDLSWIMYQMNSGTNLEKSWFKIYSGLYREKSNGSGTNVGVVVSKTF